MRAQFDLCGARILTARVRRPGSRRQNVDREVNVAKTIKTFVTKIDTWLAFIDGCVVHPFDEKIKACHAGLVKACFLCILPFGEAHGIIRLLEWLIYYGAHIHVPKHSLLIEIFHHALSFGRDYFNNTSVRAAALCVTILFVKALPHSAYQIWSRSLNRFVTLVHTQARQQERQYTGTISRPWASE